MVRILEDDKMNISPDGTYVSFNNSHRISYKGYTISIGKHGRAIILNRNNKVIKYDLTPDEAYEIIDAMTI